MTCNERERAELQPTRAPARIRPSVYLGRCARDFAYQALPFFACNIINREWPGDEASSTVCDGTLRTKFPVDTALKISVHLEHNKVCHPCKDCWRLEYLHIATLQKH